MNIRRLPKFPTRRLGLLFLAGSSLVGCTPARALTAVAPTRSYSATTDLAYGPDPRHRLDVYEPRTPDPRGTTVVFFYGGTWREGDRRDYRFVAEALARHGITTVIPDYRLYPEVSFPAYVEDAAAAVRWVRDTRGAAPLFVAGHSAGAHLAALVAYDGRYLSALGLTPATISGLIGVAGPYDFLPIELPAVREVFADVPDLQATQPVNFVAPGAPPALLLQGEDDTTVRPRNAHSLAQRLRTAGSPARAVVYPQRGHVDILFGLSSVFAGDGAMMSEVLRFVAAPQSAAAAGDA